MVGKMPGGFPRRLWAKVVGVQRHQDVNLFGGRGAVSYAGGRGPPGDCVPLPRASGLDRGAKI